MNRQAMKALDGATTARLLAGVLAVSVMSLLVITGSRAAFTADTQNAGNSWNAGGITLTDDAPAATAMFSVTDMQIGVPDVRCIAVTYDGAYGADVRLYGTVGGSGLAPYLDIEVEVGTGGQFGDCSGFVSQAKPVDSTLAAFGTAHAGWESGAAGFTSAATETTRTFRFTVTLRDDDAAQNKGATASFTWEAQTT